MPAPLERSGGGSCALTGAAGNRSRAENVLQHNKYALRITRNGPNYPRIDLNSNLSYLSSTAHPGGNRTRAVLARQPPYHCARPRAGEKEERGNKYPTAEAFKFLFFPRCSKGAGTGAETIL